MNRVGYDKALGVYWIHKRVLPGQEGWLRHVVKAAVCPDQRAFRRLTRAERIWFEREARKLSLPV